MEVPQWIPQDNGLKEICELLAEYQKPSANHSQIYERVEAYCTTPEFSNYLAFLLTQGTNFPLEVRQCAGLLLKNKLKTQLKTLPAENLRYIYSSVVQALGLPCPSLRQTAGTVVSSLVSALGFAECPYLIPCLLESVRSTNVHQKEGALDTIHKICEDCLPVFESLLVEGNEMATDLVNWILHHFTDASIEVRRLSVSILNLLVSPTFPVNAQMLQTYMEGMFQLNVDQEPRIRREVVFGMTQLITFHQEWMLPYLKNVIHFVLGCTRHPEVSIVIESCEFWSAFVDAQLEASELRPVLPELLPILINNMVYEDDDEDVLKAREAETVCQEMDNDLRPFHSGDRFIPETEAIQEWTLRKHSAAGLDKLSSLFGDELLRYALPIVEERLRSMYWKHRENAILVLGAISDGCRSGLDQFLNDILLQILEKTTDSDPLVRIISCWATSRFTESLLCREHTTETQNAFAVILNRILTTLHDPNRQVQQAACSALAMIEEFAGPVLLPHFKIVLEHLTEVSKQYGRQNLRLIYDAICVLADKYGQIFDEAENRSIVMSRLLELYENFTDDDKELQPLLSCFSALALAFGRHFEPFASPIFARCLGLIASYMEAAQSTESVKLVVDSSFAVCALDMISGLVEGMGASMECLIGQSRLPEFLFHSCQSNDDDMRQSAFALLGEIVKICPSHLASHMAQFSHLAVENFSHAALTEHALPACHNACWAMGEICLVSTTEQLSPIAMTILENCVNILMHFRILSRSFIENATITLGRASLKCSNAFANHLHVYLGIWCEMLKHIRDDIEKEQAFLGLFQTIELNLDVAANHFPSICAAIASWYYRGMEGSLKMKILESIQRLKQILENKGEWESVWALVPETVQQKIENPENWQI